MLLAITDVRLDTVLIALTGYHLLGFPAPFNGPFSAATIYLAPHHL
jgi:hypothetical protein